MKKGKGHAQATIEEPDGALQEESSLVEKPEELEDEEEETASVTFSAGFTRNVGEYNSVKCSLSITLPCSPTMINEVFEFEKDWVEEKLEDYNEAITEAYGL